MQRYASWIAAAVAAAAFSACGASGGSGPSGGGADSPPYGVDAATGSSSGGSGAGIESGTGAQDASLVPDSAAGSVDGSADAGEPDVASAVPADAAPPADAAAGTAIQITVSAGAFDRASTVVSFPLPGVAPGRSYVLRDSQGQTLALQVDAAGGATFILPSLMAGAEATFAIDGASPPPPDAVTATSSADGVDFAAGTTRVMHYQTVGKLPPGIDKKYLRGGYLHPVYTPTGKLVTDDYPPDHRHHHGIWSAWVHSSFQGRMIDFWNMGMGLAKVDFDSLEGTWNGPVHGGIRTHHVFVDLTATQPTTALRELWVVTLYRVEDKVPYFLFDVDSTQETATSSPLMIEDYYYGGFGIRGNAAWFPADFLTSEGLDRTTGDGKTGNWLHIGGLVSGQPAGYAILGHPTNFRAPQPMRLNPTEPFMSFAPPAAGAFSIDPGTQYKTRFRFVVSDGAADPALLARIFDDYATPPTVTVH